jgi:phosphosulfolactate synthase
MNFNLNQIPSRTTKPRNNGLTIVSDKGLSLIEAQYMISAAAPYVDMVKLAFGTALLTPNLKQKIDLYQSHNIPVFLGGLLFEAFVIRNQIEEYIKMLNEYDISHIEISDGALNISHEEKCDFIRQFTQYGTVISEIGSKDKDKVQVTPPYKWIQLMQTELDAGSTFVVAEAKEAGNVGLYRNSGEVREGLVEEILTKIPARNIIWESPEKDQQLYFIKLLGCNANLANIQPNEVIPLETMRLGLRGDSFELFLGESTEFSD